MIKKLKICLIVFSTIILLCMAMYIIYKDITNYNKNIKMNWGIVLSDNYKTRYQETDGVSFLGDGDRYSVLEIKGNENNEKLNLTDYGMGKVVKKESADFEINEVLEALKIPNRERPQDVSEIYVKKRDSLNYIYIMVSRKKDTLYVIESYT